MIGQRQRKTLIKIRRNNQARRLYTVSRNMSGGKISFRKIWKGIKKVYSHGKKIYENPAVKKLIDIGTSVLRTRYPKKMAKVEGVIKKAKNTYRLGDKIINRGREIFHSGKPAISDFNLGREAYNDVKSYWGNGNTAPPKGKGARDIMRTPLNNRPFYDTTPNIYSNGTIFPPKGKGLTKYKKRKPNMRALKSVSQLRTLLKSVR